MNNDSLSALIAGSMALVMFVSLAIIVLYVVCFWKIFTKAGQPGWAALIPIYNLVVMFQIAGMSGLWALAILATFIPIIGGLFWLGVLIYAFYQLSLRFGQGAGFTVGLVLLGFIFWPILAFGD